MSKTVVANIRDAGMSVKVSSERNVQNDGQTKESARLDGGCKGK